MRWATLSVDICPLLYPAGEGFVFPKSESFLVDDSGLDDLTIWENTPSHSVHVLVLDLHALLLVTLHVHGLITDRLVLIQVHDERVDKLGRDEELKVGLLVDVAIGGTPADKCVA